MKITLTSALALAGTLIFAIHAKAEYVGRIYCDSLATPGDSIVVNSSSLVAYDHTEIHFQIGASSVDFSTDSDPGLKQYNDVLMTTVDFANGVFSVHAQRPSDSTVWLELYAIPSTIQIMQKSELVGVTKAAFTARINGIDPRKTNPNMSRNLDFNKQYHVNCVYRAEY